MACWMSSSSVPPPHHPNEDQELSNFNFIDKSGHESVLKWNSNKKIKVIEKDLVNSINFLCPPCVAVFKNVKKSIKKEIDTRKMKYKEFSGKIKFFSLLELYKSSVEEKYGVFVVDGMIFRKEDFGMKYYKDYKDYKNDIEKKKKEKIKCCKNYKKYLMGKSSII